MLITQYIPASEVQEGDLMGAYYVSDIKHIGYTRIKFEFSNTDETVTIFESLLVKVERDA